VLLEATRDFDHNLIVYRRAGLWGSVSQSRHEELRGKPPTFASLRELVLSYYPDYFSDWTHDRNDLTLRGFSPPIDLRAFGPGWVTCSGPGTSTSTCWTVRLEGLLASRTALSIRSRIYDREKRAQPAINSCQG
jgi:hypothetical protein